MKSQSPTLKLIENTLIIIKKIYKMSDERRVKKLNTKKKFVADGVFNAELNAFLSKILG